MAGVARSEPPSRVKIQNAPKGAARRTAPRPGHRISANRLCRQPHRHAHRRSPPPRSIIHFPRFIAIPYAKKFTNSQNECTLRTSTTPHSIARSHSAKFVASSGGGSPKLRSTTAASFVAARRTARESRLR